MQKRNKDHHDNLKSWILEIKVQFQKLQHFQKGNISEKTKVISRKLNVKKNDGKPDKVGVTGRRLLENDVSSPSQQDVLLHSDIFWQKRIL